MSKLYNLTNATINIFKYVGKVADESLDPSLRNRPEHLVAQWKKWVSVEPSGYQLRKLVAIDESDNDVLSTSVTYRNNQFPSKEEIAQLTFTEVDDGHDQTLFIVDREEGLRRKLMGVDTFDLRVPGTIVNIKDCDTVDCIGLYKV